MDKLMVAQGVANKMWATEQAVDAAIAEAAGLLTGMIEARTELRLSATVGAEASAKVAEAIAVLAQARAALVAAHKEMEETKLRVGIRTKLIGTFGKEIASQTEEDRAVSHLRVAA